MGLFSELRSRARHVVGPVIGICAIGYFAYHAISGQRGMLALRQLTQQVAVASLELDTVRGERKALEHNVKLLHPESLDPDMLDERARLMLGYGYADDIIVLPDVKVILPDTATKQNSRQ